MIKRAVEAIKRTVIEARRKRDKVLVCEELRKEIEKRAEEAAIRSRDS